MRFWLRVLGDDAVAFFDAITAVHKNLGASRSQRKHAGALLREAPVTRVVFPESVVMSCLP